MSIRFLIIMIAGVILVSGCTQQTPAAGEQLQGAEMVSFETSDGFVIHGSLYTGGNMAIILLHMLSRDRSTWNSFAERLNENGYTVLSIDLRGHGESITQNNQSITFQQFTNQDFNNMVLDIAGAKEFLNQQGLSDVSLIGASIGANVALRYAVFGNVNALVLLSPGLDYRGVTTEDVIGQYANPLLIVASEDDDASASASRKLHSLSQSQKELKIYQNAGHGTSMFSGTDLEPFIIQWLEGVGFIPR